MWLETGKPSRRRLTYSRVKGWEYNHQEKQQWGSRGEMNSRNGMEVVLIRFGDQKTGMRKWKDSSVTLTCMPAWWYHSSHSQRTPGLWERERENEFHFRYVEGLRNIQGDTIRSPGLEFRQVWSWSEGLTSNVIPQNVLHYKKIVRGIYWFMFESVKHFIKILLIHSFHKYPTASPTVSLVWKICQTQHGYN